MARILNIITCLLIEVPYKNKVVRLKNDTKNIDEKFFGANYSRREED